MENSRLTWRLFHFAVSLLLLGAISQAQELEENQDFVADAELSTSKEDSGTDYYGRRQDNDGFSFQKYFFNGGNIQQQPQQQQQQGHTQTLINSNGAHLVGQNRLVQPDAQQQQQQQQALQAYFQQTSSNPQQQLQQGGVQSYQANQQHRNQYVGQQPVVSVANRDGVYGSPEVIKFESTPGTRLGNLWKIMKILSAGGKVMMGLELGNNFYFGPVKKTGYR